MRQKGQTLVASLIVIAIIALLAVVLLKGGGSFGAVSDKDKARPDGRGGTIPGLVTAQAEDTVCRSNLGQIRMSINIHRQTDDTPPSSLEQTGLGPNFYKCPTGGEKYQYDPTTGNVFCPHLGHEKY